MDLTNGRIDGAGNITAIFGVGMDGLGATGATHGRARYDQDKYDRASACVGYMWLG